MSRTVFCRRYQSHLEGLEAPPFPGAKGEDIFANISKKAWQDWLEHQRQLINEKHLSMTDAKARAFLADQREKFFSNQQDVERAEGYVPPKH